MINLTNGLGNNQNLIFFQFWLSNNSTSNIIVPEIIHNYGGRSRTSYPEEKIINSKKIRFTVNMQSSFDNVIELNYNTIIPQIKNVNVSVSELNYKTMMSEIKNINIKFDESKPLFNIKINESKPLFNIKINESKPLFEIKINE